MESSAMPARVIVGVGGSGSHARIARTAVSLARDAGRVLYAVDVRNDTVDGPRTRKPAMQDAYRALAQVRDAAEDLDMRLVITSGEPGATLLRLANQPHDLLVVGNSRRGRTGRDGGVAARCAARARCSVVLVPIDDPEAAEPGSKAQWTDFPPGGASTADHAGVPDRTSGVGPGKSGARTETRTQFRCASRSGRNSDPQVGGRRPGRPRPRSVGVRHCGSRCTPR